MVDTSILFAASYDLDIFNTKAVELFDMLSEFEIPIYTNVNIRAEFIDLHRRVYGPHFIVFPSSLRLFKAPASNVFISGLEIFMLNPLHFPPEQSMSKKYFSSAS